MELNYRGLSIIIPYYKGEKYITNTIKSIEHAVNKTQLAYEIIVVNDNPKEHFDEIQGKKIKIFNNELNQGVSYSRNIGRKKSKYDYLYFIDQDDYVHEDFFLTAENYIDKNYDVIIFNYLEKNQNKAKQKYNFLFKHYFYRINSRSLMQYGNLFKSPGQVIFRKDSSIPFLETKTMGADDFYLFLDFFLRKSELKITYIHEPLFIYRKHQDNYTKVADFKKSSIECFKQYELIRPEVSKYEKILLERYYGNKFLRIVGRFRELILQI